MQHTLYYPSSGSPSLDAGSVLNVVIAYEDLDTGKHAKRTYDYLVRNLGPECQLLNQMWKLDVLVVPKLREIAVKDAAIADILLISSHGRGEFPGHAKTWLDSWLNLPRHTMALVALFDCPREEAGRTSLIRSYLAEIAKRAQVEFFAQPDDWPGHRQPQGTPILQPRTHQGGKALSALAGVIQQDITFPRWGINE